MSHRPTSFRHLAAAVLLASFMFSGQHAAGQAAKSGKAAKAKFDPARWEKTIQKFEAQDAKMLPPEGAVLLIGGSNARRWTNVGKYLPKHTVINRGFGGAKITDVLHFTDRIVLPYKPKVVLLNAGGNDLGAGRSPEQIRDTARAFIAKVHAVLPDTRIYCIGLPVGRRFSGSPKVRAAILAMNGKLAELAGTKKNVEFIDLAPAFLDDKGQLKPGLYVTDGIHFTPKGYKIIANLLREKL